jgi:hypothetical protein
VLITVVLEMHAHGSLAIECGIDLKPGKAKQFTNALKDVIITMKQALFLCLSASTLSTDD